MSTDPRVVTRDARRTPNRLLDVLQRERIAGATDTSDLGPSEIHAKLALIERAKGALMLHYGVDSHQAFAVLVGWARISHIPLPTIARTLLRGICEGNPQTEISATGVDAVARGAASRPRSWPRTTPAGAGPM
ncbi:ANTAR domain-containing protein [Nocardioides sp.]|uniref:ANTAR domain-containing protein n=1 Tax=Nocardioides sp. TaxID=35761 RepID=UPI002634DFB1|nr:ANTAR domain-containing protein [Nocardioides sp.]MCW2737809.1 hypothetical protein [Nocardioides sp.]